MFEAVVSRLVVLLPFIFIVCFMILKVADVIENTLNNTLGENKDEKKAYKVKLEPSEVSDSIFIELEANSEFREHDRQIGYIEDNKVTLYSSTIEKNC